MINIGEWMRCKLLDSSDLLCVAKASGHASNATHTAIPLFADGSSINLSTAGKSTREARLGDVGLIVLDEVRLLLLCSVFIYFVLSVQGFQAR